MVNFPDTTMDVDELRVFDAATGAAAQRYRSWCKGVVQGVSGDLLNWTCSAAPGQSVPASQPLAHRIQSMAFLFGKK
jgi:surfactin synthase thioesterase subunit